MTKRFRNLITFIGIFAVLSSPIGPVLQKVLAVELVSQSVEVCFVATNYAQEVLSSLPESTSISLQLYTDPGHLSVGKVNSYGNTSIPVVWTSATNANTRIPSKGQGGSPIDAYCTTQEFTNEDTHEYTYTQATITSELEWLPSRYNDEVSIDFVDPDIAFSYSNEWFDDLVGNESQRNKDADGHITMSPERLNRRLVVVAQLNQNLPDYGVVFTDSAASSQEYTLSTIPTNLSPDTLVNLRFGVQNTGKLTWKSGLSLEVQNPVNVSYHWKNLDTGQYTLYEGGRALLNHDVAYTLNDSNISLAVRTPNEPGSYQLVLDLVHEGITWFSQVGADTRSFNIQVGESEAISTSLAVPELAAQAAGGFYYIVQPGRPWDPYWRCGGYDCLSGIAEEFYHCSANGIPNYSFGTDENALKGMCWWPIYNANRGLPVPPDFASHPWDFVEVGWVLYIPPFNGGGNLPQPSDNFSGGVLGSTTIDPYAGMNGAYMPWPQITFDRFVAWDGSWKSDQIKWSETTRPTAPTVTGLSTDAVSNTVTVYGVAIPKGHPMNIRVWNEFRYCWACASGWEFHYQQGSAQHVKIVLFKEGWQYLGEVWNDRSDGRWAVTLPLGTNLNPGDRVFAEVQVEADYTFEGLRWWSDTFETVNFNIRDPKYFGYPYFASGGGNLVTVPAVIVDDRSTTERAIDDRANLLGATGGGEFTNICGTPAKFYSNLRNGQAGAVLFVNNRTVYSWGGTWDTFNWYGDRCDRFGVPVDDPHDGGIGPYNTAGAYQDFQKGRIYWSWKYVGKFVYGAIWNKFEQAGGTNSHYGWPTSETYVIEENGISSVCQNFEGGSICDTNYVPDLGIVFEDFTGIENEEILLEPDLGSQISDALTGFFDELGEFLITIALPPFDAFEGMAKVVELLAHYLYGAAKGLVESVVDAVVFVKEIVFDGKLEAVFEGLKALIADPKLVGYLVQDQLAEFITKPFLERVEMLGSLSVNVLLIASAGYGIAKGAVNLFSKGFTTMKETIIAGQFGGKITKFVYGGVEAAIQLGKNGLVRLEDLGKQLAKLSIEEGTAFIQNLRLAAAQERYLYYIQRLTHVIHGEYYSTGVFKSGLHHFPSLVDAGNLGKVTYSVVRTASNGVREVLVNGELKTFFPDWFTTLDIESAMKIFPVLSKRVNEGSRVREMTYKGLVIRGYVNSTYQVSDTIFPIFIP